MVFGRQATVPAFMWASKTRMSPQPSTHCKIAAIDTLQNKVIATIPIGQAPQGVAYIPNAVPQGDGTQGLQPLGLAGKSVQLWMAPAGQNLATGGNAPTSVSLSDQGLVQVLEAAVTGLEPNRPYILALSDEPSGAGVLEPLQSLHDKSGRRGCR